MGFDQKADERSLLQVRQPAFAPGRFTPDAVGIRQPYRASVGGDEPRRLGMHITAHVRIGEITVAAEPFLETDRQSLAEQTAPLPVAAGRDDMNDLMDDGRPAAPDFRRPAGVAADSVGGNGDSGLVRGRGG